MTNKTFIEALAAKTGSTKKATKEFVDAFEVVLKETVVSGKVKVADLTFTTKDMPARKGHNPVTGESIDIPARKRLIVKPSLDFKALINE
jgi:DNA-binding protein HU-beta